ncbi:Crp/Fnr family transcriptional regulator [Chitinophaga tropicalis]|uniref:Cyclic nucleotide-binding domain-containing protein n=1 Tax=Chitinophaga tropicalis TaxID=2683588 RepID=A0A7K1U357_9BACT|nr:Crp/Fnr family transcriptional regulator [Chitinophaga tropicalis]MVT08435.1 cyclic nucleotide-binding domain-containing protein [Chitinophaga tropicalis]
MSIRDIFPIDKWDFKSESILADLPEDVYELLIAHKSELVFRKNDILFREGSFPSGIFYIVKGKIKKYKVDNEGKEQIIYLAGPGQLIGYHAILSDDRYPDSAAAIEDSVIVFIPKEDFLKTLDYSPVLNYRLLKTLSHEFAVLANNLTFFAQKTVRERLALQLVIIREKYKENYVEGMPIEISISREDLASLVGTARESIVRILAEFKGDGILETRGRKIIIKDVNALIKIADHK